MFDLSNRATELSKNAIAPTKNAFQLSKNAFQFDHNASLHEANATEAGTNATNFPNITERSHSKPIKVNNCTQEKTYKIRHLKSVPIWQRVGTEHSYQISIYKYEERGNYPWRERNEALEH